MNLADPILGESSQSQQDSVGCHSHEVPRVIKLRDRRGWWLPGAGEGKGQFVFNGDRICLGR